MNGSGAEQDAAAITARARILLQLDRYDEARLLAQDALASDPSFVEAHVIRAQALLLLGSPEGALEAAHTAWRHAPHEPALWRTRADALLAHTPPDHVAAHRAAQRAVSLAPEDVDNHLAVARCLMLGRDRAGLRRTVARIGELAPHGWVRPLAEAMMHLQRARSLLAVAGPGLERTFPFIAVVLVSAVGAMRGAGHGALLLLAVPGLLVVVVLAWLAHVVRRHPHLVRADACLREALSHEPESAYLHLVRADVLRQRFRFRGWVGHEGSAARLDIRRVDGSGMVLTLRLAEGLTITAAWALGLLTIWLTPWPGAGPALLTGTLLGAAITGFARVVRPGTAAAPPAVRRAVERSPWSFLSLTVGLAAAGAYVLAPSVERPERIAALVLTGVLVVGLAWFVHRWWRGVRVQRPQPWSGRR